MAGMTCDVCQGKVVASAKEGWFVCEYCDTEYPLEWMKAKFQKTQNIKVDGPVEVKSVDFDIRAGVLVKYNGAATEAIVPEGVVEIGDGAFQDCKGLITVHIPWGVTMIGLQAFSNCIALKKITLPESCLGAKGSAFEGCINLQIVEIQAEEIGGFGPQCFKGCESLIEIKLPKTLALYDSVFQDCVSLKTVALENVVQTLGSDIFQNCSALETVAYPKNFSSIGTVFRGCTGLKRFVLPEGMTEIPAQAFANCSSLETITLYEGIQTIQQGAFMKCDSLTTINFPSTLKVIQTQAFHNCKSLRELVFPKGLEQIGPDAFSSCKSLRRIYIPTITSRLLIGDGAFIFCTSLTDVIYENTQGIQVFPATFQSTPYEAKKKQRQEWHEAGRCDHCGGELSLFGNKCKTCGKKNLY